MYISPCTLHSICNTAIYTMEKWAAYYRQPPLLCIRRTGIRIINDSKSASAKKPLLALDVILSLVVLGLFKYTGMIVTTINQIAHSNIPVPAIVMPIGISFFTFQSMSYVIDVYRERVEVQTNFFKVLLYISFFPQLIAGPIVKYRDISKEIDERHADAQQVMQGLQRFIIGLSKKVLISNTVGQVADHIFAACGNQLPFTDLL